jgi:hypothetical protein
MLKVPPPIAHRAVPRKILVAAHADVGIQAGPMRHAGLDLYERSMSGSLFSMSVKNASFVIRVSTNCSRCALTTVKRRKQLKYQIK